MVTSNRQVCVGAETLFVTIMNIYKELSQIQLHTRLHNSIDRADAFY